MGIHPYCLMQINKAACGGVYKRVVRSTGISELLHQQNPLPFNNGREVYIKHLPTHCLIKTVFRGELPNRDIYHQQFQPGDKVKVIHNYCGHNYSLGSILTIRAIHGDIYRIKYGSSVVMREELIPAFGYFPTEEDLAEANHD